MAVVFRLNKEVLEDLTKGLDDPNLYEEIYSKYDAGEKVVIDVGGTKYMVVHIEPWTPDCLYYYLEKNGEEVPGFDDEEEAEKYLWDVLGEAIEWVKKEDGYDSYIYVPPEVSGESFGVTIWLKRVQ